jgi:hypothetical protein
LSEWNDTNFGKDVMKYVGAYGLFRCCDYSCDELLILLFLWILWTLQLK